MPMHITRTSERKEELMAQWDKPLRQYKPRRTRSSNKAID